MRGVDDGRGGSRTPSAAAAFGCGVVDGVDAADDSDARNGRKSGRKKSLDGDTLRDTEDRTPAADSRKRARRDSIGPRFGVACGALIFEEGGGGDL